MTPLAVDASGATLVETGAAQRSTHGLVRMAVQTDGDTVIRATPALGSVYRGLEKLAERHAYEEVPVLLDRADHLAAVYVESVYAMSLERLMGMVVPPKAHWIRALVMEMGRMASHLLWLGSWARDAGLSHVADSASRQHAAVSDLMSAYTGRRTIFGYIRTGGVAADPPVGIGPTVTEVLDSVDGWADGVESMLSRSHVFGRVACGTERMDSSGAVAAGVTGPCLRAFGIASDIRRTRPYAAYADLEVGVPIGNVGDCRDRCLVRIEEVRWSARIARQALEGMPAGAHATRVAGPLQPPAGEVYSAVESPRGELGIHLVSDGSRRPYRLRLRPPSFYNLGAASTALAGVPLDVAGLVLASFDLVAGEVER